MTLFIMIVFVVLLLLAVPVGLSVGIASMMPSLLSDSFTVSGVYILRSALGGVNSEYSGAAKPPVRCGGSHLSGLTGPHDINLLMSYFACVGSNP